MQTIQTKRFSVVRTVRTTSHPVTQFNEAVNFIEKPDPVRRKRPLDLFANGTSRTVYSRVQSTAEFWASVSNWPYNEIYTGDSVHRSVSARPLLISQFSPRDFVSLENKVRLALRDDFMSLSMMMAEYRQTASTFSSLAHQFVRFTTAFRRKDPSLFLRDRGRRSLSKRASDHWLEYVYGVVPLMSDMSDTMRFFHGRALRPYYIHGGRQLNKSHSQVVTLPFVYQGQNLGSGDVSVQLIETQRIRYKAKVNTSALASTLSQTGLSNPALLTWELIPFSFVVDWWFNVGDVLASVDSLNQIDYVDAICSSDLRGLSDIRFATSKVRASGNCFERRYVRDIPYRMSLFVRPEYRPGSSLTHVANGLALLSSLTDGLRKTL